MSNKRFLSIIALFVLFCPLANAQGAFSAGAGHYTFNQWSGGVLNVEYYLPSAANADSPILFVVPGARRNADDYRDQWIELAEQHQFIVLAMGCSLSVCRNEYQYNLGGITDADGNPRDEAEQLFSAPEQIFTDFTARFGSKQKTFALYGHSAGGGFVHLYMLARPNAPVSRAVAANPAFFTLPSTAIEYPFGLKSGPYSFADVKTWFAQPLTILLGDQDLGPRTKALSNSAAANAQGANVFTRGLTFYAMATNLAVKQDIKHFWQLDIVHGVGHSSGKIVPYAYNYLFEQAAEG